MTREEALVVFELLEDGKTYTLIQRDGIVTLDWKQPDPETGLVRCGCGGEALYDYYYESDDLDCGETHSVSCKNPDCWIEITANKKSDVFEKWNRAMGYRKTPT